MINLNLPNSGSANWGFQINAILQQINGRLNKIETDLYVDDNISNAINLFPYGGSGIVGNSAIITSEKVSDNEEKITFTGTIYSAGTIRSIITFDSSAPLSRKFTRTSLQYQYVYIKYDSSQPSPWTISTETSFQTSWSYILIGVLTPLENTENRFIKQVFSAEKTSYGHKVDYANRYIWFPVSSLELTPTGLDFTPTPLEYFYYSDGVNYGSDSIDEKNFSATSPMNFQYFVEDSLSSDNKKFSSIVSNSDGNNSNCFRILLTIDQCLIKQYYRKSLDSMNGLSVNNLEHRIQGLLFNNNIENLSASGFVEIARCYNDTNKDFSGNGGYLVFPSENNQMYGIPSNSIKNGTSGEFFLDQWIFKKSRNSGNSFNIDAEDDIELNKTYAIPRGSNANNSIFLTDDFSGDSVNWVLNGNLAIEALQGLELFTGNSDVLLSGSSNYYIHGTNLNIENTTFNVTSEDNITLTAPKLQLLSHMTLTESEDQFLIKSAVAKVISIDPSIPTINTNNIHINSNCDITFISDKRHKENINLLNQKAIAIVENTPVVSYNYINSTLPQIGIISQDLEANLSETEKDCFIQVVQEEKIKDCKRLKETKLVYILWKALQEEICARKQLENKLNNILGE